MHSKLILIAQRLEYEHASAETLHEIILIKKIKGHEILFLHG